MFENHRKWMFEGHRGWTRELKKMVRKEEQTNEACSFALHRNCLKFQLAGTSSSPRTSPLPLTLGETRYGTRLRCRLHDQVCEKCWFLVVNAKDTGDCDPHYIKLDSWLHMETHCCFACHDIDKFNQPTVDRKHRKIVFENAKDIVGIARQQITSIPDAVRWWQRLLYERLCAQEELLLSDSEELFQIHLKI